MFDEAIDFAHQVFDVGEGTAANGLLRDDTEPAFHEIQPGRIRGGEVDVVSGPSGQPGFDFGMFVGGVVIDDQMHVEVFGHIGVDVSQEGEEFLMSMACLALGDDFTVSDIECREQRGGAMTHVVVGDPLDVAESHGQHGLSSVERLNLTFLVDAQHHSMIGWIQVQADDVAHLLDEEGVIGELEVALPMRLHPKQLEPALHGALRDAGMFCHRAHAPVRIGGWACLQGGVDHLRHPFVVMTSGAAASQCFVQALDPLFTIAFTPLANGCIRQLHTFGDGTVGLTFGTGQNDLSASYQTVRQTAGVDET